MWNSLSQMWKRRVWCSWEAVDAILRTSIFPLLPAGSRWGGQISREMVTAAVLFTDRTRKTNQGKGKSEAGRNYVRSCCNSLPNSERRWPGERERQCESLHSTMGLKEASTWWHGGPPLEVERGCLHLLWGNRSDYFPFLYPNLVKKQTISQAPRPQTRSLGTWGPEVALFLAVEQSDAPHKPDSVIWIRLQGLQRVEWGHGFFLQLLAARKCRCAPIWLYTGGPITQECGAQSWMLWSSWDQDSASFCLGSRCSVLKFKGPTQGRAMVFLLSDSTYWRRTGARRGMLQASRFWISVRKCFQKSSLKLVPWKWRNCSSLEILKRR